MAISRRKSGKVVRCPKCAGEIIVPSLEGAQGADDEPEQPAGYDDPNPDLSQNPTVRAPSDNALPQSPDASAPISLPPRRGLFIPLGVLFLLIGVGLLVLVLTFVIGLMVGKSMTP